MKNNKMKIALFYAVKYGRKEATKVKKKIPKFFF
jgi:hypothetical protein